MDSLAGKHVRKSIQNNHVATPTFLPSQQIGIELKGKLIVANVDDKLRGSLYKSDIVRHYNNTV